MTGSCFFFPGVGHPRRSPATCSDDGERLEPQACWGQAPRFSPRCPSLSPGTPSSLAAASSIPVTGIGVRSIHFLVTITTLSLHLPRGESGRREEQKGKADSPRYLRTINERSCFLFLPISTFPCIGRGGRAAAGRNRKEKPQCRGGRATARKSLDSLEIQYPEMFLLLEISRCVGLPSRGGGGIDQSSADLRKYPLGGWGSGLG